MREHELGPGDNLNVMLVEDDRVDAELVYRALARSKGGASSVRLVHVSRLKSALRRLDETDDIRLILLDLGLPDVDSVTEAVERIHARRPDLPIVAWSNRSYESAGLLAMEKGASCYLPKTQASRENLTRTIYRTLEAHFRQENLQRLVDISSDGILIVNLRREVLFANPAAARMLGIDAERPGAFEFNLPITPNCIEVDVAGEGIAELCYEKVEWSGEPALLASLRALPHVYRH